MSELESVFGEIDEEQVVTGEEVNTEVKKVKGKEKDKELTSAMKETLAENPEYLAIKGSLSGSLSVMNSLGFGNSGGLKREYKGANPEDIPKIYGYRVKNIGTEPIKYETAVYEQDANGVYVATEVEKVVNAGETFDIARAYFTKMCAKPEIAFTLENGIVKRSSSKVTDDLVKALEGYHFKFNDNSISVNDDTVKKSMGIDKVSPEFEEVFGFLNNEPDKTKGGRKAKANTAFTRAELQANYVMKMLQEKGNC